MSLISPRKVCSLATLALPGLAAACTTIDFAEAPVGRMEGAALVVWVGPNDDTNSGDGKFIYVPKRGQELVYKKETYSCIPPDLYAERFLQFVDKHLS